MSDRRAAAGESEWIPTAQASTDLVGVEEAAGVSDAAAPSWESIRNRLARLVTGEVRVDEPLGPKTTYRVGGNAAIFVEAASVDDIIEVCDLAGADALQLMVIGRGSNSLIDDRGFDGIVLSVAGVADEIEIDTDTGVVTVGGGVELPRVARQTAAAGLTGFEWAVGVPGSIGGAVRMNAGGHGSDMAASVIEVELLDEKSRARPRWVAADELGFRFRGSDLDADSIVLRARLQLARGDAERSKAEISEIVRWRREHQPGGQNCGSVFVNPVPGQIASGALIDELGLLGLRAGSARVSEKHANFIQADPDGAASDVAAVIEQVRSRVAEAHGVGLRSEVRMVGFGSEVKH